MKQYKIYKINYKPTNTVVYVGCTSQTLSGRLSHHAALQKKPTRLNKAIQTNGKSNYEIELLELVDAETRHDREYYWILHYGTHISGYNQRLATKFKQEDILKARITNYRNREVICVTTGQHFISCMDAARHYKVAQTDVSECCARRLVQVSGLQFVYADVDIELYYEFWRTKIKRNKKVKCIETGENIGTVLEAANKFGIHRSTMQRICSTGRAYKGYHYMFV
jgi:predicted DNA-binding protein (UPF0251 family)